MSRISNDLADRISYKMTEKSRIATDFLLTEMRELVTSLYEEQTPVLVKDTFKKHSSWFYTKTTISFTGHGFRWENVRSTRPIICNSNNEANLELTDKTSDKIQTIKRKYEKSLKEYEELKEESKQALLALRSFTNIRKELPEVSEMLPPPMSNSLVVNFDSLKTRLKKQPETKKEITSNSK